MCSAAAKSTFCICPSYTNFPPTSAYFIHQVDVKPLHLETLIPSILYTFCLGSDPMAKLAAATPSDSTYRLKKIPPNVLYKSKADFEEVFRVITHWRLSVGVFQGQGSYFLGSKVWV